MQKIDIDNLNPIVEELYSNAMVGQRSKRAERKQVEYGN